MNTQNTITVNEISISYKRKFGNEIKSSRQGFNELINYYNIDALYYQEQFVVLFLNRSNKVIGGKLISSGTISSCLVDIKQIFSIAMKSLSSGIIISHNHPSGAKTPSNQDKSLNENIKKGCEILDLSLIDNIIVTDINDYVSFADIGIL